MSDSKSVLGVDYDDTLIDFTDALRVYHNTYYGTTHSFRDINSYELADVFGCSVEEIKQRIFEFYASEHHDSIKPVRGAVKAMKMLSRRYTLEIVTARPSAMRDRTSHQLKRHFSDLFRELHFGSHFDAADHLRVSKSELCKRIGAVAMIEDALHNAVDVAAAGIPVYLFDKPWNQGPTPPGVTRFPNWTTLVRLLG